MPLCRQELIVDLFAGGGGASLGIEWALQRPVDIAVNHDPEAIAMHRMNHPETRHFTCDVHDVSPWYVCKGRPVTYVIDEADGLSLTKTVQTHMCGNSVPPQFVSAIVSANVGGIDAGFGRDAGAARAAGFRGRSANADVALRRGRSSVLRA